MAGQSQWTIRNISMNRNPELFSVQDCHASLSRFKPDTRLCLSISDYHPDTWNPAWSVSTILTGLTPDVIDDNAHCYGQKKPASRSSCTRFKVSLNAGLLSFMLERSPTLGSVETSDYEKKQFALRQEETLKKFLLLSLKLCADNILTSNRSLEFNLKSRTFNELFPELRKEAEEEVK